MKLKQATRILEQYTKLMNEITKQSKNLTPPETAWNGPYSFDEISIDDGAIKVYWTKYVGCGEYDNETQYFQLSHFFKE